MTLELTTAEAEELQRALGSYLSDLRTEIADTDSYDYRQGLKARKTVLTTVLARLEVSEKGHEEWAGHRHRPADSCPAQAGRP